MGMPPKAPKLFGEIETKQKTKPSSIDARPVIVLRMTQDATLEEIREQQRIATEHYAAFGMRVAIVPKTYEFAGLF